MSNHDAHTDTPTFNRSEQLALHNAFATLPYSGMISSRDLRPTDVDSVVDAILLIRNELLRAASEADRVREERDELLGQRDAVRAFLGTDSLA